MLYKFFGKVLILNLLLLKSIIWGEVYEEKDGVVAVEAEHFVSTEKETDRSWNLTSSSETPNINPDPDGPHLNGASGNAYMEILPDTRVTHSDPLVNGVSFSNTGGAITIINYEVYFNNTGTYKVWVRAYSTGSEDNGVHVGIDGNWPPTGERIQWCSGKNQWTWSGAQRTDAQHCGVPGLISIDVDAIGLHTISFSQREDGFEMDKWIMVKDVGFSPTGTGPDEVVRGGNTNIARKSIKDFPSRKKLWVFSNPEDFLSFFKKGNKVKQINIYDLLGNKLFQLDILNKNTLQEKIEKLSENNMRMLLIEILD